MSDFQWLAYVVFMVWYLSYVLTDWCRVLVFYAYTLSLALGVVKSQSAKTLGSPVYLWREETTGVSATSPCN